MKEELLNTIRKILTGIDKTEIEQDNGWWETSYGAEFGEKKLIELIIAVENIIDKNIK